MLSFAHRSRLFETEAFESALLAHKTTTVSDLRVFSGGAHPEGLRVKAGLQ